MNSITLNDVQSELSDIYVQLSEISTELTGENLLLAGIEKEVLELISNAILSNANNTLLPAGLNQQNIAVTSSSTQGQAGQNNFPVYFSNVTNVFLGDEKGELVKIEDDLQHVITIMKDCGCGVKEAGKSEGYKAINNVIKSLASGKLAEAGIEAMLYGINKLEETIDYHDKYVNATEEEKLKIDKGQVLENIKKLNTFEGIFQAHSSERSMIDGHRVFNNFLFDRDAGTEQISIAALVKAHPSVLNDKEYIKNIRRLLDTKGDPDLIELTKQQGFTTEEEREESNSAYNELKKDFPALFKSAIPVKLQDKISANRIEKLPGNNVYSNFSSPIEHPGTIEIPGNIIFSNGNFEKPQHNISKRHAAHKVSHLKNTFPQGEKGGVKPDTSGNNSSKPSAQVKGNKNNTVINIKIDGLVKQFTVNTTTIQESASQIKDLVSNVLLKAVKDSKLSAEA